MKRLKSDQQSSCSAIIIQNMSQLLHWSLLQFMLSHMHHPAAVHTGVHNVYLSLVGNRPQQMSNLLLFELHLPGN